MNRKGPYATGLGAASIFYAALAYAATPADTYFSLAVTENSHNHAGENLLFLDFQEQLDLQARGPRSVLSPRVADGSVTLDAELNEWPDEQFTLVKSRTMNNYPLSEFYDAVPVDIHIASAFDSEYIYFALRFEDANHDASSNRNRWVYDGNRWSKQAHTLVTPNAPAARAVNRAETVTGAESEDRVFFMFPIVDRQHNFRDGGLGCAGYCHTNLVESDSPTESITGADVVGMHTALPQDLADIWHWTSTRSAPGNTLKDAHLLYGQGVFNGRKADPGRSPDLDNDQSKLDLVPANDASGPAYVSRRDYEAGNYQKLGFTTVRLLEEDLLRITPEMEMAVGVSVPYSIQRPSDGSRADVQVASRYDTTSHQWLLEFRRKLDTGDAQHDHQFLTGVDALPPTAMPPQPGDPAKGEKLFQDKHCVTCHGDNGEGEFKDGEWIYPRIQRASGALIRKTAGVDRPERLNALSYLRHQGVQLPTKLMPYIPLSEQEAEDIAAWLQRQHTPIGQ